jgi:predicted flap endonuclease-1-like 5' DNA nuclease
MLYLASQFAWFLVAAFGLGLVMGWLGQDGARRQLWHPKLGYLAAIWALVAGATWTQALNGVTALWLESALLFVAAYLAGCVLGAILAAALKPRVSAEAASASEGASVEPAGAVTAAADAAKPVPPQAKPASEAPRDLPKVENEDSIPGQRPSGLVVARTETPDDLKIIKGIGPQNEERLHALGIWHFEQIANWTPGNVEWVGSYLAFPGRIEREEWVEQARALATGSADPAGTKPADLALKASSA